MKGRLNGICSLLSTLLQGPGALAILDEPKLGRCSPRGYTSPYESLLVGPSLERRYEHRVLRDTWARAERALRTAGALVMIGYSLPDADYLIRAMLARTFAHRSRDVTVVTMARTAFDQHLVEQRYGRLFAGCTLTRRMVLQALWPRALEAA